MKATAIPERSRFLVRSRDRSRCARCAVPAPNGEWHHRRSRSVRDSHTHCACNGVWLCSTCHRWAHANPTEAKATGFILPRSVTEMWTMPFKHPLDWRVPDCGGGWRSSL